MAPRRSNRLQDSSDQKPPDVAQDVASQAEKGTKRKAPAARDVVRDAGMAKRAKKPAVTGRAGGSVVQASDGLSSLSLEIFGMIADNITDPSTISALMRTSRTLYTLMAPWLYNRIAVAAMFHAHIAKLIRTLEPHLTIAQRKQLKKEGKYKGQQEKYPTGLDEDRVPICASYVRQLIMGVSDPGKKHKYIVIRYYEEALKNMENLEVVETRVLSRSICESMASLNSLRALALHACDVQPSDVEPLVHIKNLKHLSLHFEHDLVETGQRLLRNSASTLQSLRLSTNSTSYHYFRGWEKSLPASGHDASSKVVNGPDFPALKSLQIDGLLADVQFIGAFSRAIAFSKLRELSLMCLGDSQTLLWSFLTSAVTSYKRSNTSLDLRTLSIDMYDSRWQREPERQKAQLAGKCSFIASFDTLTTLELQDYGQYSDNEGQGNPGLPDTLLQAILKHRNLRVLRISYRGITSGLTIPYLGAKTIGDIVDGLPQLREFGFAPDEPQIDGISQALRRGKNLESVLCFPHASWNAYPRPEPLGMNILTSVLSTFVNDADTDVNDGPFVWEDHYKLKRLDLSYTAWNIASEFGKRKKGHEKAEKFQADTREVWYQPVHRPIRIHVGYDPSFEWVTKVAKDVE